jgi:hypothetical protein
LAVVAVTVTAWPLARDRVTVKLAVPRLSFTVTSLIDSSGGAMEMELVSRVTAPLTANARPSAMLAPADTVMLVFARIFPANAVFAPRVAEVPTWKNTLSPWAPLIRLTDELAAVINVVPIRKSKDAFGLFWASRVSAPVNWAAVLIR